MPKGDYLGEFEQIVLWALVRLRDEAYGMRIRQDLERRAGRSVSIGSVYATLDRLEDKGFVVSSIGEATPERGGRAKRYFHLTPAGSEALSESRRTLETMWKGLRPAHA